ncbi:MAG: terminase large subunit domain-containing protein, partial [Nanopusillaceae archaeon]
LFNANIGIAVISRDSAASTDFTRKCKSMLESLPPLIKPKSYKKNMEQSVILKNNSRLISTQVRPSSPESVLRGDTIHFLVIDEAAFIEKIDKAYTGMAPSITTASQVAKKKGLPYGVVILSTPNGTQNLGKWYYDMWIDALHNRNLFKPIKIHYSEAPFANEEWLETNKRLLGYNQLKINQELELQFISSEDSFFEPTIVQNLYRSRSESINKVQVTEIPYFDKDGNKIGFATRRIFEEYDPNKLYLVGIDISSSYSVCNSAIEVIKYPELDQVEEFVGKLTIPQLKEEIINLSKKYENCLIIPENNSYGTQLTQEFSEMPEISDKLYYTKVLDVNGKVIRLIPGINTNSKTKPLMMEALYWTIKENPNRIKSEALIDELVGLKNNLKSESLTDMLMALSFSYYVSKYDSDEITYRLELGDNRSKEIIDNIFKVESNDSPNEKDISEYYRNKHKLNKEKTSTDIIDKIFDVNHEEDDLKDLIKCTKLKLF